MFTLKNDDCLNFDDNHLPDFAGSVSRHLYGSKIILKDSVASGNYKILEFSNGLYAYASNYILHEDFEMELAVAKEEYTALHINQIQAGAEFKITLNNKAVSYDNKIISSLLLTGSADSFVISGSSGACVNRLKIMIPNAWLKMQPVYNEELLNNYFGLQEERLFLDAMDNTYRSMVDKVMTAEDNAFYLSITQSIVSVITERFFNRLNIKIRKGNELSGKPA